MKILLKQVSFYTEYIVQKNFTHPLKVMIKTEIKKLPQSALEIMVELPADEMTPFWDKAAEKLAQDFTLKGFRPGKVPRDIVEKTVGTEKFFNKAAELAAEKTFREIVQDNNLEPISHPEITILKISPSDDFVYKANVKVLPEVVLPDYKNLVKSMASRPQKVEAAEIQEAVEWLGQARAKTAEVERPAEIGDLVEIDFELRLNGIKTENGASKNQPLILGNHKFIPGLEENLVGLKKGEEKEFSLKVPDNFWEKNLAGKIVDFKVKMGPVKERELLEINDDFAKSLGNFGNLEELKKNIGDGLLAEKETKEKERFRVEMADKIAAQTRIDLPDILIEKEVEKMLQELHLDVESRGLNFEDYLSQIKKTVEELKKEFSEPAKRRVRIALILRALAKKEKIEPAPSEVEEKINEVLKNYPDAKTAKSKVSVSELYERIAGILTNEKVFEYLESLTK